jgi:CcmD family protein
MKKILTLLALLSISLNLLAQQAVEQAPTMADTFRSEGKIYVVIGVVLVVFIGIIIYLFNLDRKISKLEKEIKAP